MNEEIKKLIEAEVKDYTCSVIRNEFNPLRKYTANDLIEEIECAVEYVAKFILSKWQEAERWRKVEEDLPDPDIVVLCRMKYPNVIVEGFIYKHNGIAKIETQPDFEFEDYANGEVVEWKPIS